MTFYTATFCATDQELGSNPFWHTCLLLSRFDDITNKLEVVEKWGFGGTPASNSPFVRQLKVKLGLDTDFCGNHVYIYEEETRFFDQGKGLHGVTFELTEQDFLKLQKKCHTTADQQTNAIDNAVQKLELQPTTSKKIRNYAYEHESLRIFQYEKELAALENRQPRLNEFSLSFWDEARTCKVHALSLLAEVLTPQQIERLSGWHASVPRLSGPMENIYLHSAGPLSVRQRSTGVMAHYRKGDEAKLYWTLPPQEIETIFDATEKLVKAPTEYQLEAKSLIRKLQELEWFFRDLVLDQKQGELRDKLVNIIVQRYEAFGIITPKRSQAIDNSWLSFFRWATTQPRNGDEANFLDKINDAKDLLNSLYMAVIGPWELKIDEVLASDDPDYEVLAAYLPQKEQQKLCDLIGRNYTDPDEEMEFTENNIESDFSTELSPSRLRP